jgi:hypothetical protein
MNKVILASAALLFIASPANAEAVILKGQAAESFIAKYFPQASIPGPVSGVFSYIDKWGRHRKGHARCDVPAMGARSDGAVSRCSVTW